MRAAAILALAIAAPSVPAIAHGGGVDASGCHTNRKTGQYHCHHAQQPAAPPVRHFDGDTYYANCDEARAAGAAPIKRGEAGYRPAPDRDSDGVTCEPYRR